MDPTDAYPVTESELADARTGAGDMADHLVPPGRPQARRRRAAFDFVELGVTDAARRNADEDFTRRWFRHRQLNHSSGVSNSSSDTIRGRTIARIRCRPAFLRASEA